MSLTPRSEALPLHKLYACVSSNSLSDSSETTSQFHILIYICKLFTFCFITCRKSTEPSFVPNGWHSPNLANFYPSALPNVLFMRLSNMVWRKFIKILPQAVLQFIFVSIMETFRTFVIGIKDQDKKSLFNFKTTQSLCIMISNIMKI